MMYQSDTVVSIEYLSQNTEMTMEVMEMNTCSSGTKTFITGESGAIMDLGTLELY